MKDKKALLRIVKTPEGLKKARKSRALERAFDTAIPAEVYDALEGQMVAL